jgi:ribose transport system substrate-binding protein
MKSLRRTLTVLMTLLAVAAASSQAGVKVAWYFPIPHPFGQAVQEGAKAWAKDSGVALPQQIGSEWTQDSENQAIEALIAKGYEGFALYPVDASGANGLYAEQSAKGRYFVNFGTSTLLPTKASFAVATDVKVAAAEAAERLIALMGKKGNILNVLEVLADANTLLRKKGIEETVAKYPGVKIIQEIGDMSTIEEATDKVESAISGQKGKIDGIICTGYTTTVATVQSLKARAAKNPGERSHSSASTTIR